MKKILYCMLSILAGTGISLGACHLKFYPEMINFVGAMFVLGGLLFLDAMWMKRVSGEGGHYPKKYLIRLAVYFIIGVTLVMIPVQFPVSIEASRIGKAFGEAFVVLVLWNFFSYTTIEREV